MPKRKRPGDLNHLAKFIVDVSTSDAELPECQPDGKNPAAVELGKLGGLRSNVHVCDGQNFDIGETSRAPSSDRSACTTRSNSFSNLL
jgi:hypothetical protein